MLEASVSEDKIYWSIKSITIIVEVKHIGMLLCASL